MKRLMYLLMIMVAALLVACGGNGDSDEADIENDTDTTDVETSEEADGDAEEDSDADGESDEATDEDATTEDEEADSEDGDAEEIETAEAVDGNEIDVLSDAFVSDFFSGADAYSYNTIPEGSTQEDVEDMYGEHELLIDSNGTELAVYGNLAVQYSGGSAYFEGNENVDVEDKASNTVENVYIYADVTANEMINRYGAPTLNYDQFLPGDGNTPFMIWDHTRGNDYAVYAEVITSAKNAAGESEDFEQPRVSIIYKDEELDPLPDATY